MTTVVIAVGVIGVLLWFFLAPAGPAYERSKPLSALRDAMPRLAMMGTGSSLTVRHDQSQRSFSFVKGPDAGDVQQTVVFVFRESEWSARELETVGEQLKKAPFVSSQQLRGDAPDRVLECSMTGPPVTMEFLTGELIARIAPALSFNDEESFTLRLDGPMDYSIWRRVNVGPLQRMGGEDQHWIMKRFARRQLKKHEAERRKR
jgi:hypothetical protein